MEDEAGPELEKMKSHQSTGRRIQRDNEEARRIRPGAFPVMEKTTKTEPSAAGVEEEETALRRSGEMMKKPVGSGPVSPRRRRRPLE